MSVEPNPVYNVRKKMLDLILSGCHNIGETENAIWFVEYHQVSSHGSQNHTCQVDTMNSMLHFESDSIILLRSSLTNLAVTQKKIRLNKTMQ